MQTEEYLKLAAVEDQMWYFRALHRHVGRELARAFPAAASGVEVLDAGCGTGGLILALRRIRPEMTFAGLDYSELACRLARERTDATITQGSITELPYPDQSFNAVISADVICQVEEPVQALREFKRVLRPGGTVIINGCGPIMTTAARRSIASRVVSFRRLSGRQGWSPGTSPIATLSFSR
jgi:ubiquinone/menaquinone biosynthesis C-methylase UbiE